MRIDVKISGDEKKAFLTILPEKDDSSQDITIEDIYTALDKAGVVEGINKDTLFQIFKQKLYKKKYAIAESIPPQIGENARLRINIKTVKKPEKETGFDKEKKVDHYGIREGYIQFVEKDTVIASRVPPTIGKEGITVTGKKIPGLTGKDLAWGKIMGKNTRIEKDKLIAAKDGIFVKEESKLNIEREIKLDGDLGIRTGSISIPIEADIELFIPGDIKSGFTVKCRKITLTGSVEYAGITAKYLEVGRGIGGTGDQPIVADYLTTGFIMGARTIKCKYLHVKKEISGGATIQADIVLSNVIQETKLTSKYGVWTKYLYGNNDILVGVDLEESEEYKKWYNQIQEVEKVLHKTKMASTGLLKKADSVIDMAKRMPNNPGVQMELAKINETRSKIKKLEHIKNVIEGKMQTHCDNMYVSGSPFILVELGFTKNLQKKEKTINHFAIKEYTYPKTQPFTTGLYTLKDEVVVSEPTFNINDINEVVENCRQAALADDTNGEE